MEDFGSILWLLFAVGALIYSAGSKRRKKVQEAAKKAIKEAMQERANPHEAWPAWDNTAKPTKEAVPEYAPEAVSLETIDLEIPQKPEGRFEGYAPASTYMQPESGNAPLEPAAYKGYTQREEASGKTPGVGVVSGTSDTDTAPAGPAAEIKESFDLRRAVLYSEIMKPKFEE